MRILERKTLADFLKRRLEDSELIAPVAIEGRLYFQQLEPEQQLTELAWPSVADKAGSREHRESPGFAPTPDPLTVNSIKEFFFPRRQELYEQRPDGIIPRDSGEGKRRLLVFARPCDTRGLTVLDRVFLGETEDESYRSARNDTTIVGLHCLHPDRHCFCASLDGGPFGTEGMDLALTPLVGGRFLAQGISEKGKTLLASLRGKQAGETERETLEELRKAAEGAIRRSIRVPDQQTMEARFDSPYWSKVSRACLTCGICSYLCPTCHCFDIVDEGYLRVRCWDTCSSDTFTRMAAGEDHRKLKHSRYRQRVYHKFSYFREHFDTHACVGCGRCTRHCPVKIDIVEIVKGIGQAAAADRPSGSAEASGRPAKAGGGVTPAAESTGNGAGE